ncbi:MAG: hypothetical protein ABI478_03505 [Propionivibrio sp.]
MKIPAIKANQATASAHSTHWLDQPQNIKFLWRGFLMILALTVIAEIFVHLHPTFAVEGWFAFHAWFGLISCALMIAGAKALGRWVKRPDTFYARDGDRDD